MDFDKLCVDEKLSCMMRIILPLDGLDRSMSELNEDMRATRGDVAELRDTVGVIERRLKQVEYRTIDLEARSRRNNLIFFGIEESREENSDENCSAILREIISDTLGITDADIMCIQRAHRMGKVKDKASAGRKLGQNKSAKQTSEVKPRPIIAAFRDYSDISMIMGECGQFKGTGLSVSRDYPAQINKARGNLMKDFKAAKDKNRKPKIFFPAKLVIGGKVVRDELPKWNELLYGRSAVMDSTVGDGATSGSFDEQPDMLMEDTTVKETGNGDKND